MGLRDTGAFHRDSVTMSEARREKRLAEIMLRVLDGDRALRERLERQAVENAKLVQELRERQTLLERLAKIQRSISRRAALKDVLDAIVAGAHELLGDEVVALRLIDSEDTSMLRIVASIGVDGEAMRHAARTPVGDGAGGRAVSEARLVVIEGYATSAEAMPVFAMDHVQAAMASPVFEHGRVIGSLVVATRRHGRTYSASEQEMLLSFAEHASIALNDAHSVDQTLRAALHDGLTGLPNRGLLLDRLDRALARARRRRSNVALLFIDLDRFKIVNDTLGHGAGDQLLVEVAARLVRCLRSEDTAARLGGDEFAVIVEDAVSLNDATLVADRIMAELGAPFDLGGRQVNASASIGIAISHTGHGSAGELLRNADVAMYRAKSSGRGRAAVFEPGMHEAIVERLELEAALRRALDGDELILHYQPVVNLDTGRMTGLEALVRWQHPERGLVLPSEFIPVAEECGLIDAVGRWVLRRACAQVAEWRRRHDLSITVNVNLSTGQFPRDEMVDEIAHDVAASGIDPSALVLEITESLLMQDTDATIDKLLRLKALGARLAIDDFGTGYSSLSYLRRFPVDILKIDRTFVDGLTGGPEASALARAIVKLGHTLNLEIVAEGIETAEQLRHLRALRCHYGQGYLFARPLNGAEVDALLGGVGAAWAFAVPA